MLTVSVTSTAVEGTAEARQSLQPEGFDGGAGQCLFPVTKLVAA